MIKQAIIKLFLPIALFTVLPMLPSGTTGNVANFSFAQYETQPLALADAIMPHMQEAPTDYVIAQYDLSNWFAKSEEEPRELTERELEIQQLRAAWHTRILQELQKEDETPKEGLGGCLHRMNLRLNDLAYRKPKLVRAMGLGFWGGLAALLWYVPRFLAPRLGQMN